MHLPWAEFEEKQYEFAATLELMLSPDGRAHIAVPHAERGLVGIEWEWE